MLYSLKKSIKLRFLYNNVEKSKFFKNILLKNDFFFFDIYRINRLKNYISISKIRNRCIITSRSRSTFKKFRFSRFIFKEFSSSGKINGVKKI